MTQHKLVIAEKPSVAQSIAAVLGATKRNDGYLSGGGYLVSWCFGHLAELAGADVYDEKYAKWRYDDLPILPASWRFTLKADKAKQFEMLRDLMRREDVTEVINACDAGREGGAYLPHRLLSGGLHKDHEAALDLLHGGRGHPKGLCGPSSGT